MIQQNNTGNAGFQAALRKSINGHVLKYPGQPAEQPARSPEEDPRLKQLHGELRRWRDEQMFEEDVRAMLSMLRPHRTERLRGWEEYRTGGGHFRATVSWDEEHSRGCDDELWVVPKVAEVLESILIGSVNPEANLDYKTEFDMYRAVVRELLVRIDEVEACYT